VTGDRLPEPNKTFFVKPEQLETTASSPMAKVSENIVDDEPRISISDVTKREGRKNTTLFTFTVTLSAAYDQAVTNVVPHRGRHATTSDSDYVAKTGTLTFAPARRRRRSRSKSRATARRRPTRRSNLDLFGLSSNALFTQEPWPRHDSER